VAPRTFPLRGGATRWLSTVEADLARDAWVDPRAGRVTLAEYSRQWLALRTDLRPRTRELYASLLKLHIRPVLGPVEIARITPSIVRNWYAELSGDDGPGQVTAALEDHLASHVAALPDSLLFTGEKGGPLRPHVLQSAWDKARGQTGLQYLHFHDLRHSGNSWAAATCASTAVLMARMGHASAAAALRDQHATADRDRAIASALSLLGEQALASVSEIVAGERRSP